MKRFVVPALAVVVAVAVAVPALAQPETVTPRLQKISKRALVKSQTALRVARQAKRQARAAEAGAFEAQGAATAARGEATSAKSGAEVAVRSAEAAARSAEAAARSAGEAAAAQNAAQPAKVVSALASGEATTSSQTLEPLPGGPSVSVTVPPSGLIEVWAQVTMSDEGAVSLFEDGKEMPGQSQNCGDPDGEGVLLSSFAGAETVTLGTPGLTSFIGCGTDGPPAAVLFQTTPGPHTYELRYEICGCAAEVTFSERSLRVAPRP